MAYRVAGVLAQQFTILNHLIWDKSADRAGVGGTGINMESLRRYWPTTEHILFAEPPGADASARGEAGYALACDRVRGVVFEPLRKYLADEFAALGWKADDLNRICGTASMAGGHYTATSQWALPTAEHYAKLQAAAHNGHLRREYEDLRREYEDLRRESEDLRRPFAVTQQDAWTDVWKFAIERTPQHPTQKPLAMLCHMVQVSSRPDTLVCDPFTGSGTTGVACAALGRRFVGIEQEQRYCDIAIARIEKQLTEPLLPFATRQTTAPQQPNLW
jgi:site-specific DNA-methyltransferase (adenine-specific)